MSWPTGVATDAELKILKNNLSTTLNGTINNSTTTVVLTDASGFPTAGYVTIDTEAISYTGKSSNTLTGVTRAADNTTAASHSDAAPVYHLYVADHHNAIKEEIKAIETSLNLTASRAVVTSGSGRVAAATTTSTEIGYVNGVTSAIQTQIDTKAPIASPTFTGTVATNTGSGHAADFITTNAGGLVITAKNISTSGYSGLEIYDSSGADIGGLNYGNSTSAIPNVLFLGTAAAKDFQLLTNNTNRMTVTSAGVITFAGNYDGWTGVPGSWAYASATTITVPTGAASIYQVGDKIKLTQTTAKYFYITTVADTLLTVSGGGTYTVANAAITLPFYSKMESPQGFPAAWLLRGVAGYNSPSEVTFNGTATKIALVSITLPTTGRVFVTGQCDVRGATKGFRLFIYQDGVVKSNGVYVNMPDANRYPGSASYAVNGLAAGTYEFQLYAQDSADNTTLTAGQIDLSVLASW